MTDETPTTPPDSSIFTTENIRKWTTAAAAIVAALGVAISNLPPSKPASPAWIVTDGVGRIEAPEVEQVVASLKVGTYRVRNTPAAGERFVERTIVISEGGTP